MRLIDADAAIDVLKELTANGTNKGMVFGEDAVHRIEILPSIQPEQRWHPITEKPPRNKDLILKIYDKRNLFYYYHMGFYSVEEYRTYNFFWQYQYDEDLEIVGWRLCPWESR